ncbi:MAG TPA: EcsC family protein [Polyangiaceae bacterium]|nr:EcsC family protein [Polyangiaceae bacterium]
MTTKLDQSTLMKALDWAYDQAINGVHVAGFESAAELAASYAGGAGSNMPPGDGPLGDGPLGNGARRLVNVQAAKAGLVGFVAGLGGALALPVTIPANLTGVLLIQLRMIAAVAHLGGFDLHADQVRTMAFACLCGNGAADIMKDVGIQLGEKLAAQAIKKVSGEALKKINQKVGIRLVTKFGEKGLINLGKMIPIAGGIVGGTFDATSTVVIGTVARRMFVAHAGAQS